MLKRYQYQPLYILATKSINQTPSASIIFINGSIPHMTGLVTTNSLMLVLNRTSNIRYATNCNIKA